ncbi:MAG: aconitate hydratase AcnA [Planctomycetota bacterium]|nr:aconitate hydratase AcnA [Planctomycetota bacterium]MDA1106668.1 aconitate hydratase AcnA [Planctomycetota bacterium]
METPAGRRQFAPLEPLRQYTNLDRLPYSIKVLLEACLRNVDGLAITEDHVRAVCAWDAKSVGEVEIPFMPGRVVLQDFTGVPCVVDLAAMRAAMKRLGGDPQRVNPLVQCDLVIDHSVQVDAFGSATALTINSQHEFERNRERYEFLKWGQGAFRNFSVVPPATGIVHQVNIEHLAKVVWERDGVLFPDSVVGTDSHTTMVNGLGVVGWGVGGIEAEAVMLGQPISMLLPEVVGVRLSGALPEGTTATDLVLRVTQMLRAFGVVGKFVEFHGPALAHLSLANRATIANMAPEYGATIGFFPVDAQTLAYLRLTGRPESLVQTIESYCKTQGLWRNDSYPIEYSASLELDLDTIEPSLAGPSRPQDRVALSAMKSTWEKVLPKFQAGPKATQIPLTATARGVSIKADGQEYDLRDGAVVIAAITSCTNTSNPDVMIGAGLLAKKAAARGLTRKPWVKTSLAPGSKVVTNYLQKSGCLKALESLGFWVVGYGCTTCIGNSGPLPDHIDAAIQEGDLSVASVLSGNRNFEARIHQDVKANYLASPALVVAYAIAGTVDIDLTLDPLANDAAGNPVFLRDLWPTQAEVDAAVASNVQRAMFEKEYADCFRGSEEWRAIAVSGGDMYAWDAKSTYIQEPPFFTTLSLGEPAPFAPIKGARLLAMLGDSVTTDHISPAGNIKTDGPAGRYLTEHGVPVSLFNSYGSRRGNDRVMTRGTFANTRIKNELAPGTTGGVTCDFTDGVVKPIFDASVNYARAKTPLIVIAGKDYGMGSSRDWAAKGTMLLGVRGVIAEGFERIHRSNLVGMGVLPMTFRAGETRHSLGLKGDETFEIDVPAQLRPRQDLRVRARRADGSQVEFVVLCRVDTPVEVEYMRHGGILQTVLRRMASA